MSLDSVKTAVFSTFSVAGFYGITKFGQFPLAMPLASILESVRRRIYPW